MFLTNQDVVELTEWRRTLHRMPELSGKEANTAREVAAFLSTTKPDRIVTELGGYGVAAIYEGSEPGPSVMLRAELDALPIEELSPIPHRSAIAGTAHLCGHDGHMATLAAVARGLGRQPPRKGRAILLFQPAEEDGSGAAAVLADPRFADITPDFAFALHNMPGIPFGRALLAEGPVIAPPAVCAFGFGENRARVDAGIRDLAGRSRCSPDARIVGARRRQPPERRFCDGDDHARDDRRASVRRRAGTC